MAQSQAVEWENSDEERVSIFRGEVKSFGEANVEIEASNTHTVQVRITGDRNLAHICVDLSRQDAERVQDELAEQL